MTKGDINTVASSMHLALLLFILSSSLASPCPPGWWLAQDNNCFRFLASETDLSWMEATQTCEKVKLKLLIS